MTKKQILNQAIKDYTQAIKYIVKSKKSKFANLIYLANKNLNFGVCTYIVYALHTPIERHHKWIYKYVPDFKIHWCEIPNHCKTTKDILDTLKYRLKILKNEKRKSNLG